MATYTETFTGTDGVLGITTTDLAWTTDGSIDVVSNQAVAGGIGTGQAGPSTGSTDMYTQATVTAVGGASSLFLIGRATDITPLGVTTEGIALAIDDSAPDLNLTLSEWKTAGATLATTTLLSTSLVATWRLVLTGSTATVYRNSVLVWTASIAAASPMPVGTHGGMQLVFGTTVDNFSISGTGSTGGGSIDRTTDVPFLQANDRYQVIACVKAGTSTTTSEFRYWNASAPAWDLALNSDAQYPAFHTLDENATYPTASLETPFKSLKTGQEDQIQGVYVEYYARPTALTESTVTSTYSVGFTCRVEGIGTPGYERDVSTTLTSGIVVSTNQTVELTAEVNASDAWPNVRSVFLPCRMPGKIRAARVILTEIHLVAIRRIQLMGKLTPGRDA